MLGPQQADLKLDFKLAAYSCALWVTVNFHSLLVLFCLPSQCHIGRWKMGNVPFQARRPVTNATLLWICHCQTLLSLLEVTQEDWKVLQEIVMLETGVCVDSSSWEPPSQAAKLTMMRWQRVRVTEKRRMRGGLWGKDWHSIAKQSTWVILPWWRIQRLPLAQSSIWKTSMLSSWTLSENSPSKSMSAYEAFSQNFIALQAEDASASYFFWLTTYVSIITGHRF